MNKWYRSAACKGILVVISHVLVAVILVCSAVAITCPGAVTTGLFQKKDIVKYQDSSDFVSRMHNDAYSILEFLDSKSKYETEGVYNPEKLVDLKEYAANSKISGENKNGLAFTIAEIIDMYDTSYEGNYPQIIVCQRPDNTYYYYTFSQFEQFLRSDEITIIFNDLEYSTQDLLNDIKDDYLNEIDATFLNKDGTVLYTSYWGLQESYDIDVDFSTSQMNKVLSIANEDSAWNGKMSQAVDYLAHAVSNIPEEIKQYQTYMESYAEGNTNVKYLLVGKKDQKIYTNEEQFSEYTNYEANIEEMISKGNYVISAPKLANFKTNMDTSASEWKALTASYAAAIADEDYVFVVSVDTEYPIQDVYFMQNKIFNNYAPWMRLILMGGICSLILLLGVLVWLSVIAGRVKGYTEVKLNWFDRIKTEMGAALIVLGLLFTVGVGGSELYRYIGWQDAYDISVEGAAIMVMVFGGFSVGLIGYLSLVRRIKANSIWKNSCMKLCVDFVKEFIANRRYITKSVLLFTGLGVLQFILIVSSFNGFFLFILMGVEIWLFVYVIKAAIAKQRIRDGIERIAKGDVNYKIPLQGLRGDNLEIAVGINNIGEGLNRAMEESLKNERLKTDLITNVSHDIKTPLTSIINYVDILKRENFTDPKIVGYLDILEIKSQRLKHLTEDVVEASKISSGNISLEFMNLNLIEMINQTNGEFAQKFEAKHLEVIQRLPEESAIIRADGRRMWRVLENVYNNAAKYAMEGTRIYADLLVKSRTVEFHLKNISAHPLNITADELTERFIRGDVSRSTEGSGLGLSIAKSLTQMQGGDFDIYLDGDLFKVTITFPKVYVNQSEFHQEATEEKKQESDEM